MVFYNNNTKIRFNCEKKNVKKVLGVIFYVLYDRGSVPPSVINSYFIYAASFWCWRKLLFSCVVLILYKNGL